jgi:hypothetical protein
MRSSMTVPQPINSPAGTERRAKRVFDGDRARQSDDQAEGEARDGTADGINEDRIVLGRVSDEALLRGAPV